MKLAWRHATILPMSCHENGQNSWIDLINFSKITFLLYLITKEKRSQLFELPWFDQEMCRKQHFGYETPCIGRTWICPEGVTGQGRAGIPCWLLTQTISPFQTLRAYIIIRYLPTYTSSIPHLENQLPANLSWVSSSMLSALFQLDLFVVSTKPTYDRINSIT